jgi:hypothetical protein
VMSDIGIYKVSPNSLYIWGWGKEMIVMVRREETVTTATKWDCDKRK